MGGETLGKGQRDRLVPLTETAAYWFDSLVRQQFTQKERDTETGWITSWPDTIPQRKADLPVLMSSPGGPYELYDFVDAASENPTFYADFQKPQSPDWFMFTSDHSKPKSNIHPYAVIQQYLRNIGITLPQRK